MSGSGGEDLPDVREKSVAPPGCPGMVGWPSWMSGSSPEAVTDDRVWSGGPPGRQ